MNTITIPKKRSHKKIKLHSYAGEWVAFVGEKIIAHDKNLKNLIKQVEVKGFKRKASVFLVPRKDEGPYVLIIL